MPLIDSLATWPRRPVDQLAHWQCTRAAHHRLVGLGVICLARHHHEHRSQVEHLGASSWLAVYATRDSYSRARCRLQILHRQPTRLTFEFGIVIKLTIMAILTLPKWVILKRIRKCSLAVRVRQRHS